MASCYAVRAEPGPPHWGAFRRLRRLRPPGPPRPGAHVRSLRQRLAETVRSGAPPSLAPPDPGLERLASLERSLLGESGTGLSLRERLERLVRVAGSGRRVTPVRPTVRPPPLEEALPHARVAGNARGRFVLVEEELSLDRYHGDVSLSRFRALCPGTLAVLAGEASPDAFASFRVERTAFLDTETTGLAGGAGTAAFLVGAAWVRGDRLLLR